MLTSAQRSQRNSTISWVPKADAQLSRVWPTSSMKLTSIPPESMASIRASVSLLRMQSINWRCVRSPALSKRRSIEPVVLPLLLPLLPPRIVEPGVVGAVELPDGLVNPPPLRGRAFRPSKRRTRSKSTSLIVSKMQRSSPLTARSIASGSSERRRS